MCNSRNRKLKCSAIFSPNAWADSVLPTGVPSDGLFHGASVRRFAGVSEGAMGNSHDDVINIGTFEHRGRA